MNLHQKTLDEIETHCLIMIACKGDEDYLRSIHSLDRILLSIGTDPNQKKYWDNYNHFANCILEGTSRKLAEMFACAQPPKSNTDVEFLRGHCNGNQFGDGPLAQRMGDYYRSVAESGGQSTQGKVYLSSLASFPGDPRAWVSDRSEAQAILRERDWNSDGLVSNKSENREQE